MSKLKTKRKKHYLAAAMLAMLAVATPITLYGSMTTYAQTDDAAGAESGEDTGEVTNEETGYHYQKTGEPLVEEKDNNGNIWRIYAAAENTADTEATADTADAVGIQKMKSILLQSRMVKVQTAVILVSLVYFRIMNLYSPSTISYR